MTDHLLKDDQSLIPHPGEIDDGLNPLARALLAAYTGAIGKFTEMTKNVDTEALPEPHRSGVISVRFALQQYQKGQNQVFDMQNPFDQMDIAKIVTTELELMVTSLPAWTAFLFENYRKKFASISKSQLRFYLLAFIGSNEAEDYFVEGNTHDFILDCLTVYQNEEYVKNMKLGEAEYRILNIPKMLGSQFERYRNSLSLQDAYTLLKRKVHQIALTTNQLAEP